MNNKILFCNIAYTKFYDSYRLKEVPQNGGSYVAENGHGHEINNFHVCEDGKVRGFVETKSRNGSTNQLHIEKIDPSFKFKDSAYPVDVVFCAFSNELDHTVIVGWYKDATVLRGREEYNGLEFNIITEKENAHLVPEENRNVLIPRARTEGFGFGQSNIWYANSLESKEIVSKVRNLIYDESDSENIVLQNLYKDLSEYCSQYNVIVEKAENFIIIDGFCKVYVLEECYKISKVAAEWKQKTTYLTNVETDKTFYYYVDTYDECIGEVSRIVDYYSKNITFGDNLLSINDYKNEASDWIDRKIEQGIIKENLKSKGSSRQFFVTPALFDFLGRSYSAQTSKTKECYISYQIEIKEVKGNRRATFRLTCHQTPAMPQKLREQYKTIILPMMGRSYRDDGEWYDMTLVEGLNITDSTTLMDISSFLDKGFTTALEFEKNLLSKLYI